MVEVSSPRGYVPPDAQKLAQTIKDDIPGVRIVATPDAMKDSFQVHSGTRLGTLVIWVVLPTESQPRIMTLLLANERVMDGTTAYHNTEESFFNYVFDLLEYSKVITGVNTRPTFGGFYDRMVKKVKDSEVLDGKATVKVRFNKATFVMQFVWCSVEGSSVPDALLVVNKPPEDDAANMAWLKSQLVHGQYLPMYGFFYPNGQRMTRSTVLNVIYNIIYCNDASVSPLVRGILLNKV